MFVIVAVSGRLSAGSFSDRRFPSTFCGQRVRSHFIVLLVLFYPVVVLPCSVLSCLCASQVVCDLTGGWNLRSFLSLLPSFLCFGSPLLCVDFSCCGRQGLLSRCGAQLLLVAVASLSAEHEL